MTRRQDDRFRPKVGRPRKDRDAASQRFISRVVKATHEAGARAILRQPGVLTGRRSQLHRGAAARATSQTLSVRARRVTIKTRLINLRHASRESIAVHVRYIQRDGVTRDGSPTQAYGPQENEAHVEEFVAQSREDRHQFRFIVSPEDAVELDDLRAFTRDFMTGMEKDLGTRLQWIAVDHWDTDNPHTHIVLRGKDDHGHDLVIAREYISHGMRTRASELATEWLGPRTEREIRESLFKEVDQERWTSIDRMLQRDATDGAIDLRRASPFRESQFHLTLKMGRLRRLETMGLANEVSDGKWMLQPDAELTLRAMGERGDIIRTMQRAFKGSQRHLSIVQARDVGEPIVGRVTGKGMADELSDRNYVIVDGIDGRAHYITLSASVDVSELPVGGIVTVQSRTKPRAVDQTIVDVSENGIYRADRHREIASTESRSAQSVDAFVAAHERRLEALRRAGMVERIEAGVWHVPTDLPTRARDLEIRKNGELDVVLTSHLPIEKQIRAIGATWLDRQLSNDPIAAAEAGFGSETRSALRQRLAFLVDEGFAERRGGRVVLPSNLLASLQERELLGVGQSITTETGMKYHQVAHGKRVAGTYQRAIMLSSGKFALISDDSGFTLVPWRPVLEKYLGREVRGQMIGASVNWAFTRSRSITL